MNAGSLGPILAALHKSQALIAVTAATMVLPLGAAQVGRALLAHHAPPALSARTVDRLAAADLTLLPVEPPQTTFMRFHIPLPPLVSRAQPQVDLPAAVAQTDIPLRHRTVVEAQLGHLVYGSEQPGLFWVLVASDPGGTPTVWIVDAESGIAFTPLASGAGN